MKSKVVILVLILLMLVAPAKAYEINEMKIVFTLHDILMDNLEYDYDYNENSYTADGAIHTGKATCQGYALAFHKLLDMTGLENNVIIGTVNGGLHSWNCVKIDGVTYYIDLTWNDIGKTHYWFKNTELPEHTILMYLY